MKSISIRMAVMTLAWFTLGCEPIIGTLNVKKTIILKHEVSKQKRDPFCFGGGRDNDCDNEWVTEKKNVSLLPYSYYSAKLEFPSEKKLVFKVKDKENRKKEYRFEIKVPKGKDLPKYHGRFDLSSHETGIAYDLTGSVDTEETQSELQYGTDSCTYEEPVRVCEDGGQGHVRPCRGLKGKALRRCRKEVRKAGQQGRPRCKIEYKTRWGTQDIEYYYEYTTRNLDMLILDVETKEELATFSGSHTSSRKNVTYRGRCY